jgi:protein FAM50
VSHLLCVELIAESSAKRKLTKNPDVDTSFLPDREREAKEREEREDLRQGWLAKQERVKHEIIEITYSYWDGSGHRKVVDVGCVMFFAS